jgi:D-inositol-3-phosphate glycosyltransferase
MNALMISLDSSLILKPDGGSLQRHIALAERAGSLTILVRAPQSERRVHGRLTLIPVRGMFMIDALSQPLEKPDLIITQDLWLTALIGLRLRARWNVPLLMQNHSSLFTSPTWLSESPLRNRLLMGLARWTLPRTDFYRPVNQRERDHFVAQGGDPSRVIALPLGTASRHFAEPAAPETLESARARMQIAPDDRVILWVGYPHVFKRVPLLLSIFAQVAGRIPEARLVIIGDLSVSPDDLPALAEKLGIRERISILPSVPHEELPAYYQAAEVYALTSSREGVPRVLMEASAAGLPLVGFAAPGVDEVIRDGENGILVPEGDTDAFSAALISLLDDPARARALGEQGQQIALATFDAERYPDRWVGVWEAALKAGRRSR